MTLKKIFISTIFIYLLNGCAQNAALIAPAYTLVSSGNVYNASISYGSSKVIKKITGKTITENLKDIVEVEKKKLEEQDYDEFFALVKSRIEETSKVLKLTNQ